MRTLALLLLMLISVGARAESISVGSKTFTESYILEKYWPK